MSSVLNESEIDFIVSKLGTNNTSFNKKIKNVIIIDNSGSMSTRDGNKYDPQTKKYIKVTRYEEALETLYIALDIYRKTDEGCIIYFINNHEWSDSGFYINKEKPEISEEFQKAINYGPSGCTDIATCLKKILPNRGLSDTIKINLLILCDGNPTYKDGNKTILGKHANDEVVELLKIIGNYDANVVVRTVTDDEKDVEFWYNVDKEFTFPFEVLDDCQSYLNTLKILNPQINGDMKLYYLMCVGGLSSYPYLDKLNETELSFQDLIKFNDDFGKHDYLSHEILKLIDQKLNIATYLKIQIKDYDDNNSKVILYGFYLFLKNNIYTKYSYRINIIIGIMLVYFAYLMFKNFIWNLFLWTILPFIMYTIVIIFILNIFIKDFNKYLPLQLLSSMFFDLLTRIAKFIMKND